MNFVLSRIKELMKSEGLTVHDFSFEIDEKPHRINNIMLGTQRMPVDVLLKIVKRFDVNVNWLLLGKGKMYDGDVSVKPFDALIIEGINAIEDEEREAVMLIIERLVAKQKAKQ